MLPDCLQQPVILVRSTPIYYCAYKSSFRQCNNAAPPVCKAYSYAKAHRHIALPCRSRLDTPEPGKGPLKSLQMSRLPPALADPGPGLLQRLEACCASDGAALLQDHPTALLGSAECT